MDSLTPAVKSARLRRPCTVFLRASQGHRAGTRSGQACSFPTWVSPQASRAHGPHQYTPASSLRAALWVSSSIIVSEVSGKSRTEGIQSPLGRGMERACVSCGKRALFKHVPEANVSGWRWSSPQQAPPSQLSRWSPSGRGSSAATAFTRTPFKVGHLRGVRYAVPVMNRDEQPPVPHHPGFQASSLSVGVASL